MQVLMRVLTRVPAVGFAILAASAQIAAASPCTKPGVPLCMNDATTFVSADRMASCQFEVKDYVDRTMEYLHCLNEENVQTGRELTQNVERFNCHLSGRGGCQ